MIQKRFYGREDIDFGKSDGLGMTNFLGRRFHYSIRIAASSIRKEE